MLHRRQSVVILSLLLIAPLGGGGVQIGEAQGQIKVAETDHMTIWVGGEAIATKADDTIYAWTPETGSRSFSLTVDVDPKASESNYIVGVDTYTSEDFGEWQEIDWKRVDTAESSGEVRFEIGAEDEDDSGDSPMRVRLHENPDGGWDDPKIDQVEFTLKYIRKDGDLDGDGLSNQREVDRGTDITRSDSDRDGLEDGEEIDDYGTSPSASDSDNDGLEDGDEVNRHNTDPMAADTDQDRLNDGVEINDHGTNPETPHSDGDGLADGREVNELGTNPTRTDTDGDGLGDGAEVDRGTNPSDPSSPGDTSTPSEKETQTQTDTSTEGGTETQSQTNTNTGADGETRTKGTDTDSTKKQQSEDSSDFQRGFLTNNPNSSLSIVNSPVNLTTIGILLSILGIVIDLTRGR